jgi:hypothetical protein
MTGFISAVPYVLGTIEVIVWEYSAIGRASVAGPAYSPAVTSLAAR